ncbi:plasmid mobilization relaxosome protein MobC, partial [Streptococcus suis]
MARVINQTHLISMEQLQGLGQGMAELVSEVEKDFQIKAEQLRDFYGH